jgi:hypothetical protein
LNSGTEVSAVSDRSVPITAITCGSWMTCSVMMPTCFAAASRSGGPSLIETKLMPKSPAFPPAWEIASFSASTMSRESPRPGCGSDE